MSGVSREVVFSVGNSLLMEFDGQASTDEIVAELLVGETQVRKALDSLEAKGFIQYSRDGRSGDWEVVDDSSLFKFLVSEELEDEFNSYEDRLQWCRENL